jgi:NAD(P)-dependent dehydrogenase (short-subunit alcohol dehydrogenase family)
MDKTVIITGANSGIGRAATIRFAKEGYHIIMACRNLGRGKPALKAISEETGNKTIDLMELDLSSFESIRQFCDLFKQTYSKLDILIHNAGYFKHGEKTYQLSPDGIELSFAVNAFGPYYMTSLLLDELKQSDNPRILHACSTNIRHFFEPKRIIEFDNLLGEKKHDRRYSSYKMYGDSKMALLMLNFQMAKELEEAGIHVNAVQIPAIKMTKDTMNKMKSIWKVAARLQNLFSAPVETMADTYYTITTSDQFKDVTGQLINAERKMVEVSHYSKGIIQDIKQFTDQTVYPKYAIDEKASKLLWKLANQLIEKREI